MADMASQSVYKALDASKKEIRLLKLLPTGADSEVSASCELTPVSLVHDSPIFAALSYVWGDPSDTEPILLNGMRWQVTRNLAAALRRLTQDPPDPAASLPLWADALCINQNDDAERSQQVSLMGVIYSSASCVYSWLGLGTFIPTAFKTLRTVAAAVEEHGLDNWDWLQNHPELCTVDLPLSDEYTLVPNSHWMSLRQLVDLPYWSRMWIFQEIVLSKTLRLFFLGPQNTQMIDCELREVLTTFRVALNNVRDRRCPEFVPQTVWDLLPELAYLSNHIWRLLSVREELFATETRDRAAKCLLSAFSQDVVASDPRDYYYSLIGVAQLPLKPDYRPSKPVEDVCLDFVCAYLDAAHRSDHGLLFLQNTVGLRNINGLPSWAPPFHLPNIGNFRGPDSVRCADKGIFDKLDPRDRPRPSIDMDTMRVLGKQVTTVSFVGPRPGYSFLFTGAMTRYLIDFSRRHGSVYITKISVATALFATLQMNANGEYDTSKGLLMIQILRDKGRDAFAAGGDETAQLWKDIEHVYRSTAPQSSSHATDRQALLRTVVYDWAKALHIYEEVEVGRLFETAEGYLGIAPLGLMPNDTVCVLDGFHWPVILRAKEDHYIFAGPCYVLGLMNGEAKDILRQRQARARIFELR